MMKKSIIFSTLLVLSLVFAASHLSNAAAISCGTVVSGAAPCLLFVQGKAGPVPSKPCCQGLQRVAQSVKSVDDKKAVCRCLKDGVKSFGGGVQDAFLSKIPGACHINVGFPVSSKTNCET
ncbi:OLC1v1024141C2 [Oldenlandia corymbosa var. corymbosa]|nr:OLC1v1024141C2 [Oldenlandia corymbosa var. corymbosa]